MKKSKNHIALLYLLGATLLFNQVGLNFFHGSHTPHEIQDVKSDQAKFLKHDEHCKLCGLETLFHLFHQQPDRLQIPKCGNLVLSFDVIANPTSFVPFINGRAPPVI